MNSSSKNRNWLQEGKHGREHSCLPEKLLNFTGRENEIENFIKFLQEKKIGIVSLHGGPGFGKSALAVEASHRLCDGHNMVVIFCDLSTTSTIEEMNLRLCRNIGINPEEDPKSSLNLWLKNLKKEAVFLLDDIDNLLQTNRSEFDKFIRSLRKNSNQKLKIITTSRTIYTIEGLLLQQIKIKEMKEQSSMVLLKSACPNQNDEFLQRLAEVCGYVPLAMCIAASLVHNHHDPGEILKHLEVQPLTALNKDSEGNQFLYTVINASYKYLSAEQKDTLLRLSIFEGDFSENAAKAILSGNDIRQKTLLTDLVNRCLLKTSGKDRYSIHSLIRKSLIEQSESEEKRAKSEKLMVEYFLHLCAKSTVESYLCDKFMENSEIFKKEAHNIEKVLVICSKLNNPEIAGVLCDSEIYKSSCRFFYHIVRNIIPKTVIENFLQACANLAEARKEWTKKINFDCILVDQEGRKSFWSSDAYFKKMKATEDEFRNHEECLTKDVALQGYFLYQLGRSRLNYFHDCNRGSEVVDTLRSEANEHLCKSLELRKSLPPTTLAKADVILSLIQLGNLWKKISAKQYGRGAKEDGEKSSKQAEEYLKEAEEKAKNNLGKHELTLACYKSLGDLFLQSKQNEAAMKYLNVARNMREELKLNSSEHYVVLLNNIGKCLLFLERYTDAIEILEKACSIDEKLVEDNQPTVSKGKVYTSLAMAYKKSNTFPKKAKSCAERALKINRRINEKVIKEKEVKNLQNICKRQLEPTFTQEFSEIMFALFIIVLVLNFCFVYLRNLIGC